jgi:cephalosporin hydroxylase
MRLIVDSDAGKLIEESAEGRRERPLYSKEAFEILSRLWLKVGWNEKYPYTFSWMGRPVIQIPEDLIRVQEVIYRLRPDVIVETGVAHGGSLIFYASLCKVLGKGRVVGVDIEIRPHNRRAIEAHELFPWITLIEGDSTAPETLSRVAAAVAPGGVVMVILDSNHTRQHVLAELEAYHRLVSPGSYVVAADGSMQFLGDVPRGKREWDRDNPVTAVREFLQQHPEFVPEIPSWPFNESALTENITHWTGGWLRRKGS